MVAARKITPNATPVAINIDPAHRSALRAPKAGLKSVLAILGAVAPKRSSIPILGTALVRTMRHGGVRFMATDLNLSASYFVEAWGGIDSGDLACNVKALSDVVKGMPEGDIELFTSGSSAVPRATVKSGAIETTIEGFHGRDFPKIPTPGDDVTWSTVEIADLLAAFDATDYAVCLDETRFHLNGLYIAPSGRETVATDGHRLALSRIDLKLASGKGLIVPSAGIKLIRKVCKRGTCEIGTSAKECRLFVRHAGWELAIKTIDAQFPPYLQVIPSTHKHLVTVDRAALLATAKRAATIAIGGRGMRMSVHSESLVVSCDGSENGTLTETIASEGTGKEFAIGVNPDYLVETLDAMDDERVTMAFGAELDPIVIRSVTDATTRSLASALQISVIMPMRI